jgi:hypothetical protein
MALSAIIDALQAHLGAAVTPAPTTIGGVDPAEATDLPAVTLAVESASRGLAGVGRAPTLMISGALPVRTTVNLADPVLRFLGDADTVPLLSDGRQLLQLPHAPIVHADGSAAPPPLTGADVSARITGGTVYAVTADAPAGDSFRPDAVAGTFRFGGALPDAGTLELGYVLGQWQTRAVRYQGLLTVRVYAGRAADVETLSRRVDVALRQEHAGAVPGLGRISPEAWGPIGATPLLASARVRAFSYRFDFEDEEPLIPTGGGVIARVHVHDRESGTEFDITRRERA